MKALRLTNSQIKARSRPNLNGQLAQALEASGYPVVTVEQWERESLNPRLQPVFVAEYPFQPKRSTWDYRKKAIDPLEKARWQFFEVPNARRWRWDFFCPMLGICIDLDGGSFVMGGHARGAQSCLDYLKRNEAEIDGFLVLRLDGTMLRHGVALDFIQRAIRVRQR